MWSTKKKDFKVIPWTCGREKCAPEVRGPVAGSQNVTQVILRILTYSNIGQRANAVTAWGKSQTTIVECGPWPW